MELNKYLLSSKFGQIKNTEDCVFKLLDSGDFSYLYIDNNSYRLAFPFRLGLQTYLESNKNIKLFLNGLHQVLREAVVYEFIKYSQKENPTILNKAMPYLFEWLDDIGFSNYCAYDIYDFNFSWIDAYDNQIPNRLYLLRYCKKCFKEFEPDDIPYDCLCKESLGKGFKNCKGQYNLWLEEKSGEFNRHHVKKLDKNSKVKLEKKDFYIKSWLFLSLYFKEFESKEKDILSYPQSREATCLINTAEKDFKKLAISLFKWFCKKTKSLDLTKNLLIPKSEDIIHLPTILAPEDRELLEIMKNSIGNKPNVEIKKRGLVNYLGFKPFTKRIDLLRKAESLKYFI